MKKIFPFLMIVCCLVAGSASAKSVSIQFEKAVPQAAYSARKLGDALKERGYALSSGPFDYQISLAVQSGPVASRGVLHHPGR